jgi:ABC-type transport system substrate-binding protein
MVEKIGPLAGHPTDQLLLPISAGFRDWKVYSFHPNLAKARQLAQGLQQGQVATLVVGSTGSPPDVAAVIQSNLARIGLSVQVRLVAPGIFPQWLVDHRDSWDIATATGNALRVDPMVFINLGLEGQRWTTIPGVYNFSGFDDPEWITRMQRTNDMEQGRLKAYALLDRDLMEKAVPVAPFAMGNTFTFVSARVGCMRSSANPGYLYPNLAALCFRR